MKTRRAGTSCPPKPSMLAIGHSARDTFESLLAGGVTLRAEALLHRRAH